MNELKIAISGITGKMGSAVFDEIQKSYHSKIRVEFGICSRSYGEKNGVKLCDLHSCNFQNVNALIDFTTPEVFINTLRKITETAKSTETFYVVSGTTGIHDQQLAEIKQLVTNSNMSLLHSPNFSILVNLQIYLSRIIAKKLSKFDYNFGLVDEHHVMKKDSPSGTAKKIIKNIISEKSNLRVNFWHDEIRTKDPNELDVSVLRLGGTVGMHELRVVGQHGRLTLETLMYSRSEFAKGAIEALLWLVKNGRKHNIHTFEEVIGTFD
ncbi:MAG: 4-hydroxy-tetrahydrodipicolinate reductase [Candidatus Micrarchaeota archaeon]|nr:4-hydroxy-tetrahydrodipicolinate reductase [Candidatus Micrarchaeota archaeon]